MILVPTTPRVHLLALRTDRHAALCIQAILIVIFVAGLCGCQRKNPLDQKIAAKSPIDFTFWRQDLRSDLSPEQWHDFDESAQEIKFEIMGTRAANETRPTEEIFRERINGQAVREVVQAGYRHRVSRLLTENAELENVISENKRLRTRPGDTTSADHLKERLNQQIERLGKNAAELMNAKEKLKAYGTTPLL